MTSKRLKQYFDLLEFEESLSQSVVCDPSQHLLCESEATFDKETETATIMSARKLEEFINLIETAEKISSNDPIPPLNLPRQVMSLCHSTLGALQ